MLPCPLQVTKPCPGARQLHPVRHLRAGAMQAVTDGRALGVIEPVAPERQHEGLAALVAARQVEPLIAQRGVEETERCAEAGHRISRPPGDWAPAGWWAGSPGSRIPPAPARSP